MMDLEIYERLGFILNDLIHLMHDVEDTGKNKRVSNKMDKAVGILYEIISSPKK